MSEVSGSSPLTQRQSSELHFAQKVRSLRAVRGLSQKRLAGILSERSGITLDPTAITRIETGDRVIRLGEAVAIADALGVPLAAMLPLAGGDVPAALELPQAVVESLRAARDMVDATLALADSIERGET